MSHIYPYIRVRAKEFRFKPSAINEKTLFLPVICTAASFYRESQMLVVLKGKNPRKKVGCWSSSETIVGCISNSISAIRE